MFNLEEQYGPPISSRKGKDVATPPKEAKTSTRLAKLIAEVELMKGG